MGKLGTRLVGLGALGLLAGSAAYAVDSPPGGIERHALVDNQLEAPLHFEPNVGPAHSRARFVARGRGYSLDVSPTEAVLALRPNAHAAGDVVRLRLKGARPASTLEPLEPLRGKSNYIMGADPSKWRMGVPHYGRLRSKEVYPGIGVVYYGNQQQLEYDFEVAPGADPRRLRLAFDGIESVRIDAAGNLVVATKGGDLLQRPALAYQEAGGVREPIQSRYVLLGKNEVGFALGVYDKHRTLVVDPLLVYSTYLGGSAVEEPRGVAVDGQGAVYLTGMTGLPTTTPFPTTTGAYQTTYAGGGHDVFVTKLDPAGHGAADLIYSTYLGGPDDDIGWGIAVDATGAAYVVGETSSAGSGFPTTVGAFQRTSLDGRDAFLVKLDPTGGLAYATYLGGGAIDEAKGVAVDASGVVYVTGMTQSTSLTGSFPTTAGSYQSVNAGSYDAFVVKIQPLGTGASDLLYSTLFGGAGMDFAEKVRVHGSKIYVAGYSSGPGNLPTTPGAYQVANAGAEDAFLAVFNPAGSGPADLVYATYLGGSDTDICFGLAVDASGVAYLGGQTSSAGLGKFPTTAGAYQTVRAGLLEDAFVAKINPAGAGASDLVYSTYIGGPSNDYGVDLAIDSGGTVFLTGSAGPGYPTTADAYQTANAGDFDAFLTRLNPVGQGASDLLYSTFFGGVGNDSSYSIALDAAGVAHLAGSTFDSIPTTAGAFQTSNGGSFDVFLAKLSVPVPPPMSFFTVTPCRLVDTRGLDGPLGGPALVAALGRAFTLVGHCNVPSTARAVSANITVTGASAEGDLRLYPASSPPPVASTINYRPGQTRANNAILSLSSAGGLVVFCEQASGSVHFILDVNGYLQ